MRGITRSSAAIFVTWIATVLCQENEICTTTSLQTGRCVTVRNCPSILKLIRYSQTSYDESLFADSNQCGALPHGWKLVCCPVIKNEDDCGTSSVWQNIIANRIYGGTEAEAGQFPWAGLIVYRIGTDKFATKCGCTLVNSRWVITAAHCIIDVPSQWRIHLLRFNEVNSRTDENCEESNEVGDRRCREEYRVKHQIVHPLYRKNDVNMRHDIALLKTTHKVRFHKYLKPICLPFEPVRSHMPMEGEPFVTTGWGETSPEDYGGTQQYLELYAKNNSVCNDVFAHAGKQLSEEQICAGGEAGRDTCRGDSGGPLMQMYRNVNYLVGIVSYGVIQCGTENQPGVYTNVEKYLSWIEEVMIQTEDHSV